MLAHVEPSTATAIASLVVCLVLVFGFEPTNGFHDTKGASPLGPIGLSAPIFVSAVRLFHVVLQIPMPVLKFMGRSLL